MWDNGRKKVFQDIDVIPVILLMLDGTYIGQDISMDLFSLLQLIIQFKLGKLLSP